MTIRKSQPLIATLAALLLFSVICQSSGCDNKQSDSQKAFAQQTRRFPQPTDYVNDFAGILSEEEETILSGMAAWLEKKTTAQAAVVTIETFKPYDSIEQYATDLFNEWGIGQKDKNNGVLILVALQNRATRIEVGYGLEKTLTNSTCKQILQSKVSPRMREGAYYEGIRDGLQEIIFLIEKEEK